MQHRLKYIFIATLILFALVTILGIYRFMTIWRMILISAVPATSWRGLGKLGNWGHTRRLIAMFVINRSFRIA